MTNSGSTSERGRSHSGLPMILGAFLILTGAQEAACQRTIGQPASVAGTVRERGSLAPVETAELRIAGSALRTLSNAHGYFTFPSIPPGRHLLVVEHLAYETQSDTVELESGESYIIDITLTAQPIELEGIDVTATPRRYLTALQEINYRMERGFGEFLTRREFAARGGTLGGALQGISGLKVSRRGGLGSFVINRRLGCAPQVYLDGVPFALDPVLGFDEFLTIELEVVEIYKGAASVPPEYSGGNAMCGAIGIWTRPVRGGGR